MWGLSTVEINLVGRGGGNSGSVLLLGDPRNPPSISVNGKTNKAFVNFKVEKKLEEPIGKWNKINATFDGSKVEVSLNGVQTFVGSDCSPSAGKIFFSQIQDQSYTENLNFILYDSRILPLLFC